MEGQVSDLSATLSVLIEEIRKLRASNDAQYDEICRLTRLVESLNATIRKRDKKIEELETKLSKYETPDKNSTNSSTPPSKEKMKDEVVRRTKTLRKPTGRKPGGQTGHKGNTLKRVDAPDEIEEVASNYCTSCGAPLDGCERKLDYVTQVVSIPELKPLVKEVRHYITTCRFCGERIQSHEPRRRGSNAVVYDASVKALVVYLNVVLFLPYCRIERFFKEALGLEVSQGSMVNWVNAAKKGAEPAVERIKELIMQSDVAGYDETGMYCNKRLDWTWIAQTVYFTLLFRANGRSAKELDGRFGSSLERMTAVTDRHSAYFALNFLNHQVCLAHLLRELQYLNELDENQQWSRKVEKLLQEAIHERNENPQTVIDKKPWLDKLDTLLKESLEGLEEQFEKLKKGLIKCREYIFTFLGNPSVPPDNNASERGLRNVKIKMKNSGTFRSEKGADAFLDILSVVETAKKHDQSAYGVIRALF